MMLKYITLFLLIGFFCFFSFIIVKSKGISIPFVTDNQQADKQNYQTSSFNKEYEFNDFDSQFLDEYLQDKDIGLAYYNFTTDESYYYNADSIYQAASTVKVGVAMIVCEQIHAGLYNFDDTVIYQASDYSTVAGDLQYEEVGSSYTILELLEAMLIKSDNVATNMLFRVISLDSFQNRMDVYTQTEFAMYTNEINAKMGLNMIMYLYQNPEDNPYFDDILKTLNKTIYNDRSSTHIPDEIIYHKIGDLDLYYNDVAIIDSTNDFAISIYTNEGPDKGNEYISFIADYLYQINTSATDFNKQLETTTDNKARDFYSK